MPLERSSLKSISLVVKKTFEGLHRAEFQAHFSFDFNDFANPLQDLASTFKTERFIQRRLKKIERNVCKKEKAPQRYFTSRYNKGIHAVSIGRKKKRSPGQSHFLRKYHERKTSPKLFKQFSRKKKTTEKHKPSSGPY